MCSYVLDARNRAATESDERGPAVPRSARRIERSEDSRARKLDKTYLASLKVFEGNRPRGGTDECHLCVVGSASIPTKGFPE
jgi:hypothetical protein